MVVTDKALVKQLQKEVARLEAELRVPVYSGYLYSETLLQEKDSKIQKMQKEMKELEQQRDIAQLRLTELLEKIEEEEQLKTLELCRNESETATPTSSTDDDFLIKREVYVDDQKPTWKHDSALDVNVTENLQQRHPEATVSLSISSSDLILQEIHKIENLQQELAQDANQALETLKREVKCLRLEQAGINQDAAESIAKLQNQIHEMHELQSTAARISPEIRNLVKNSSNSPLKDQIWTIKASDDTDKFHDADAVIEALEKQIHTVQISLDNLVLPMPSVTFAETLLKNARTLHGSKAPVKTTLLNNSRQQNKNLSLVQSSSGLYAGSDNQKEPSAQIQGMQRTMCWKETPQSDRKGTSVDIKKLQNMFKATTEENMKNIHAYVTELKGRVAKLQYQKQLLVCEVFEFNTNECAQNGNTTPLPQSPIRSQDDFEKKRSKIFELWDLCQVSIIHRSQFYILFTGDPADAIYMEVELRRLLWLQKNYSEDRCQACNVGQEQQEMTLAASAEALKRERELLVKHMRARLTLEDREAIYKRWGIPLGTKQRKLQVAHRVWSDHDDEDHIKASAELVGRLVGFWGTGSIASKEMFELSLSQPRGNQKPWLFGWDSIATLFNVGNSK